MKVVVLEAPGRVRIEERPIPEPGEGQALVEVERFGLTANKCYRLLSVKTLCRNRCHHTCSASANNQNICSHNTSSQTGW